MKKPTGRKHSRKVDRQFVLRQELESRARNARMRLSDQAPVMLPALTTAESQIKSIVKRLTADEADALYYLLIA